MGEGIRAFRPSKRVCVVCEWECLFWFRNMMSEVGSEEWNNTVEDIFGRLDTLRLMALLATGRK